MKTIWVITQSINSYDQEGDYFIAFFHEKPTFQELKTLLNEDDVTTGKLTRGGGRQGFESVWYYLTEMKSGELYIRY